MISNREIRELLDELDGKTADDLESAELDFKEWDVDSVNQSVNTVVKMAICMANGGGGTVVFGVKDDAIGRSSSILGVPADIEVDRLRRAVHDRTDPTITPDFRELKVDEGTGRILAMIIHRSEAVYTDTSGKGTIRVGTDCKPLTGSIRRELTVERGVRDFTAGVVEGDVEEHLSASAMERLREAALREGAPEDLSDRSDRDLLSQLGVIEDGHLTRAGLLLCGKQQSIQRHIPQYEWTYLKMKNETEYLNRLDGQEAIPVAIERLMQRLMIDNPINTVEEGLFHFEYRLYPEIALREALLNAFSHADFRLGSPIMVKHFEDRVEISNPGGFIGGISEENILHHSPVSRNPSLVRALVQLRLVNRSNLGVQRMYKALLEHGKEPPAVQELGDVVKVTFMASELSVSFRKFIEKERGKGVTLSIDNLLILQYLVRHTEITTGQAATICQRPERRIREVLSEMQMKYEYLDRGGSASGTYWRLRSDVHERLSVPGEFERDRRIDWETAKTRVLHMLKERASNDEEGLQNKEVRKITSFDRKQVTRLFAELREEGHARSVGHGRGARWVFDKERQDDSEDE
jgi:ATP-dependent DNA helicase RecG